MQSWISIIALLVSLLSAAAQFGMMLIHCRRDKKNFAELQQKLLRENSK